jgi:hypothetical protein
VYVFEFRYHYAGPVSDLGGMRIAVPDFGEALEDSRWFLASHRPQQVRKKAYESSNLSGWAQTPFMSPLIWNPIPGKFPSWVPTT